MPETMDSSKKLLRSYAMRGRWSEVCEKCKENRALWTANITGTGDTVLHMAVSNGQEKVVADMVQLLVDEHDEEGCNVNDVLGAENDRKNTPLHLAAIYGNVEIFRKIHGVDPSLIAHRTLIAHRNIAGETPLFLAALNGRKEAFLWLHYLYVGGSEVSSIDFAQCIRDNNDNTILHCAIAEGHADVAIEIVHLYEDYLKEMMMRNKEGLSPLHILAAKRSAFKSTALLQLPSLARPIYRRRKVEEKNGATTLEELQPMQGKFIRTWLRLGEIQQMKEEHTWWHRIMTKLLQHASKEDMSQIITRNSSEQLSISLQTEEDYGKKIHENSKMESMATLASSTMTIDTPLMTATKNGVIEMMESILESFPSTIQDVNVEGKNILLLAIEYRQTDAYEFLCEQKWLKEDLFRQVDKEGNNALHLAGRLGVEPNCWGIPIGEAHSLLREISWFDLVKMSAPRGLSSRYNRKMETPTDILRKSCKELVKIEEEWVAKTSQACSVVSTLVVAVAFATRTSIPGGYDDKGYAILRSKPQAFKIFKDSSLVALFFSLMSTICFLSIVASPSQQYYHTKRFIPSRFYCGVYFMFSSIVCLWISFCAGDFFLLDDNNQKLHKALPTYILLSSGFILMVVSQVPGFLQYKYFGIYRTPPPRIHDISPIQNRRTENKENGPDLNHKN